MIARHHVQYSLLTSPLIFVDFLFSFAAAPRPRSRSNKPICVFCCWEYALHGEHPAIIIVRFGKSCVHTWRRDRLEIRVTEVWQMTSRGTGCLRTWPSCSWLLFFTYSPLPIRDAYSNRRLIRLPPCPYPHNIHTASSSSSFFFFYYYYFTRRVILQRFVYLSVRIGGSQ